MSGRKEKSKSLVLISFILLLIVIVGMSYGVSTLKGQGESESSQHVINLPENMTVSDIARINGLEIQGVEKSLKLKDPADLQKTLSDLGISSEEAKTKLTQAMASKMEEDSKDWVIIVAKFLLWLALLSTAFYFLRQGKMSPKLRMGMYLTSIFATGIILGSEPNPMSTPKDIISNLALKGIFFPPRAIAFVFFLGLVFLANKFICSWGCQFGTLQDLIFRLNRNSTDEKGIFKQYKVPFVLSNSIRILFFILFTLSAFLWSTDIIEVINPFNLYNPKVLGIGAVLFIGTVLLLSLFIYRPWCHFFCPFGLAGWLVEKFSWHKIRVNPATCSSCEKCVQACPSNVMGAILKQDKVVPDCFSCGTCISVCPTGSVNFESGKKLKSSVQVEDKTQNKGA